jgi:hypothetical protein
MAIIINGISKKCVTCQNYSGDRTIGLSKKTVKCESKSSGYCAARKREFSGRTSGCTKYEKWASLK